MCAAVEEAAKKESTLLKGHNDNVPVSVTGTTYVLYKRRWLMLTTLCFLNISSSMVRSTRCMHGTLRLLILRVVN